MKHRGPIKKLFHDTFTVASIRRLHSRRARTKPPNGRSLRACPSNPVKFNEHASRHEKIHYASLTDAISALIFIALRDERKEKIVVVFSFLSFSPARIYLVRALPRKKFIFQTTGKSLRSADLRP